MSDTLDTTTPIVVRTLNRADYEVQRFCDKNDQYLIGFPQGQRDGFLQAIAHVLEAHCK